MADHENYVNLVTGHADATIGQHRTTLPRYRSHKTVSALEIAAVDHAGGRILFSDLNFDPVEPEPGMFARYTPVAGDFYVVYPDGYRGISPRKAFLEGYDKI